MMSTVMIMSACQTENGMGSAGEAIIGKSDIKIENKRLTPEALWAMGRIGEVVPSPDGKRIAYTVTYYSVELNKSNTEVFVMDADGSNRQQITRTPFHENGIAWIKGGAKIAFLSNDNGSSQLYEMNPDGTGRTKIAHYKGGISGFSFSPDETKLLFASSVKTKPTVAEKYPDLPLATGRIETDLMYKHWDTWMDSAPHPFVADFNENGLSNIKDLLEGEPYESPMLPFGGMEQLAWSPASNQIAYTCRKKTGAAYAISTDSDIYLYDLKTGKTTNLCKDEHIRRTVQTEQADGTGSTARNAGSLSPADKNEGYDINPKFSPDGR